MSVVAANATVNLKRSPCFISFKYFFDFNLKFECSKVIKGRIIFYNDFCLYLNPLDAFRVLLGSCDMDALTVHAQRRTKTQTLLFKPGECFSFES